jgi:hypothetical protein
MKIIAAVCLAVSLSLTFGFQANPTPNHDPHLQPIAWLTGGTWTAEFKTPEGKPFLIQNEIRWADTGAAISFLTRFNGQPHYYGIYVYDPAAKLIKFFYTSADGEFTSGHTTPSATALQQQFQISNTEGTKTFSSTIQRAGEDAYNFDVFQEGSDKPVLSLKYLRK